MSPLLRAFFPGNSWKVRGNLSIIDTGIKHLTVVPNLPQSVQNVKRSRDYTALQTILHGKSHYGPLRRIKGMLAHHQPVWELTLHKLNAQPIHSHAPLWFNNHLPELLTIPDHIVWAAKDIIYLNQVMTTHGPKTFQAFKDKFSLNTYYSDIYSIDMLYKPSLIPQISP